MGLVVLPDSMLGRVELVDDRLVEEAGSEDEEDEDGGRGRGRGEDRDVFWAVDGCPTELPLFVEEAEQHEALLPAEEVEQQGALLPPLGSTGEVPLFELSVFDEVPFEGLVLNDPFGVDVEDASPGDDDNVDAGSFV